jgi:hypothetical protein
MLTMKRDKEKNIDQIMGSLVNSETRHSEDLQPNL